MRRPVIELDVETVQSLIPLRAPLRDWFLRAKRDLPFRRERNPYKVWVSEVMLQQTKVAAMLPRYQSFLRRFPNLEALASAREEEVIQNWQGLGYYSRAKNLWKGARQVVEHWSGEIPSEKQDLLSVAGIGEYTANAILSLGYGKPFAVLDGNVKRVLSRILAWDIDLKHSKNQRVLQKAADAFLDPKYPSDHNEAMMELGALVCIPNPRCELCPLSLDCGARSQGIENRIGSANSDKPVMDLDMHFIWIENEGKVMLLSDSNRRFFKTIFSLPYLLTPREYCSSYSYLDEFLRRQTLVSYSGSKRHSITNHRIRVYLSECVKKLPTEGFPETVSARWVPVSTLVSEFPSSLAQKIIALRNMKKESLF